MTLESELAQVLGRLKSPRDQALVARHLGWDGRCPCSLKEAGEKFQLTRERARQVYAEALPLLHQAAATRALEAVLQFVSKRAQERVPDVERELQKKGYTKGIFSLHGVLRAAHVLGRAPGFELDHFGDTWFVGRVSELGRAIVNTAVKHVEHQGAARVSVVCQEIEGRYRGPVKAEFARRILETRLDVRWLDKSGEWFWLTSVPRNRLVTRLEKVLAVSPRIALSQLNRAISRDYRPLRVPDWILRSFCAGLPWCEISGRDVAASGELNVERLLSGGEAVTCALLREHGGVMPLSHLKQCCQEAGIQRANLWRVLSFSPLIRRVDKQVYGLIGAHKRAHR